MRLNAGGEQRLFDWGQGCTVRLSREPLAGLISHEPDRSSLPSIEFAMRERRVVITIDGWAPMTIDRGPETVLVGEDEEDVIADEEDLEE